MNKEPLLVATGITKTFSAPDPILLLRGINLSLFEQESVAIVGKSGEGKSTLLHILATLDTPTEGTLSLFGQAATTSNSPRLRNEQIGFVFQAFHLLNDI